MSATDWFQKMVKAAEDGLTLPDSLKEAPGGEKAEEETEKTADTQQATEEKPAEEEKKETEKQELPGEASQQKAGIEDWADAAAKIASLEENLAALKEEKAALEAAFQAEKAGRLAEKQGFEVKLELVKAGALDADYLCYKMGEKAQFDREGNLLDGEGLIREAKRQYPALFRAAFPADIDGVKPGDGGMGSGRRPDTGFLTYSQEQRLRGRG